MEQIAQPYDTYLNPSLAAADQYSEQADQSSDADKEKDANWDAELTDYVGTHADEFVICTWLGGAEVTLSVAANTYPLPITADNVGFVKMELEMLERVKLVVEPEEPQEPEEKLTEKRAPEAKDSKAADDEEKTLDLFGIKKTAEEPKRADEPERPETPIINLEKPPASERRTTTPAQAEPNTKPALVAAESRPVAANDSEHRAEVIKFPTPRTSANVSKVDINHEAEPVEQITPAGPPPTPEQPSDISVPAPESIKQVEVPIKIEPRHSQAEVPEPETVVLDRESQAVEPASLPERLAPEGSGGDEQPGAVEVATAASTEVLTAIEMDGPEPAAEVEEWNPEPGSQEAANQNAVEDFVEGDVIFLHGHADNSESEPLVAAISLEQGDQSSAEVSALSVIEAESEVQAPLAEVLELAAYIRPEQAQTAEIPDSSSTPIIEMPAVEAATFEAAEEEQLLAELEDDFIELFERAGDGYTLELVEAMAKVAVRRQLVSEVQNLIASKNSDQLPAGSDTHEAIKHLLISLGSNKAALQAGPLGKSAIWLYNWQAAA